MGVVKNLQRSWQAQETVSSLEFLGGNKKKREGEMERERKRERKRKSKKKRERMRK
jgi:hypothetical protein